MLNVLPQPPLERVPISVSYTEKRWHRLLMIALAMLPSFNWVSAGAVNPLPNPPHCELPYQPLSYLDARVPRP